jgi:hypothetical protein
MSVDQGLAILGVVVTVVLGVAALFLAKRVKTNRQTQKVGKGGTGIQSGRDTKL